MLRKGKSDHKGGLREAYGGDNRTVQAFLCVERATSFGGGFFRLVI